MAGFGHDVAVSGDLAVASAPFEDNNTGAVYVYDISQTDPAEIARIPGGAEGDMFGRSLDMAEYDATTWLLVGAPGVNSLEGTAYLLSIAWNEVELSYSVVYEAGLVSPTPTAGDRFGWSVSFDAGWGLVGAYLDDFAATDAGAAYMFDLRDISGIIAPPQRLTADDGSESDWFGYSVSLNGDVAAVGAYHNDSTGIDNGAVYVYSRSGDLWGDVGGNQDRKLAPEDSGTTRDAYFGYDVSVSADAVVAGSLGANGGRVFIFRQSESSWDKQELTPEAQKPDDSMYGYAVCAATDFVAAIMPFASSSKASLSIFKRSGDIQWLNNELEIGTSSYPRYFSLDADEEIIALGHFGEKVTLIKAGRTASR